MDELTFQRTGSQLAEMQERLGGSSWLSLADGSTETAAGRQTESTQSGFTKTISEAWQMLHGRQSKYYHLSLAGEERTQNS